MKLYISLIANILIVIFGLLGLQAPYVTDAFNAMGLGSILDPRFLSPIIIGLVIVGIYGQFHIAKKTMQFMSIIFEFVIGLCLYLFIFPLHNEMLGYIAVLAMVWLIVWPRVDKMLQKKKIKKIKV